MFMTCEKDTGRYWYLAFSRPLAEEAAKVLDSRGIVSSIGKCSMPAASCLSNVFGWHSSDIDVHTAYKIASEVSQFSTGCTSLCEGFPVSIVNEVPYGGDLYAACYTRYLAQCRYFPKIMQDFAQFVRSCTLSSKEGFVYPEVQVTPVWGRIKKLCQDNTDVHWDSYRGRDRLYVYGVPLYVRRLIVTYWKGHKSVISPLHAPALCPSCGRVWAIPHIKECPVCGTVLA